MRRKVCSLFCFLNTREPANSSLSGGLRLFIVRRALTERIGPWHVTRRNNVLRIAYHVSEQVLPQYVALHLDSSYFRLCPSVVCGWGTSVVLLPALWSQGHLFQGAPVAVQWKANGDYLRLSARGRVGLLDVDLDMSIAPPSENHISVRVHGKSMGSMPLDHRPGEAFRLVTLSSMRVADHLWDAQAAYANDRYFEVSKNGWVVPQEPELKAQEFRLIGGASSWKKNAPTVGIALDQYRQIAGWRTPSDCTSDDNLSLWATGDATQQSWDYSINAWLDTRHLPV